MDNWEKRNLLQKVMDNISRVRLKAHTVFGNGSGWKEPKNENEFRAQELYSTYVKGIDDANRVILMMMAEKPEVTDMILKPPTPPELPRLPIYLGESGKGGIDSIKGINLNPNRHLTFGG